jgi:BirA family transcriptional regulator, biotin operon repressor / biotin---[acetyl-CoA-carboxylase] ligase
MSDKIGHNIIRLTEVDSTNNYAIKNMSVQNLDEGTIILAEKQLSGRGQINNFWESEKGKNLLLSILLKPSFLPVGHQFLISKIISLSVFETASLYCDNVTIKWPNDIYIGDNKAAGILIENGIMGYTISYSIAGIGLNINQDRFTSNVPNPVSLKMITGIDFNKEEILFLLLNNMNKWYDMLLNGEIKQIDSCYLKRLYRLNKVANFKDESGTFYGTIKGVNNIGQLVIEKENGVSKEYHFKEVSFL